MTNSEPKVNLIYLSTCGSLPVWKLGNSFSCLPNPRAIKECLESNIENYPADAWLIWDQAIELPDDDYVIVKVKSPIDIWHVGLKLGLLGQPKMINFIQPTWMLNRDPDPNIEATSWRLSLCACLIRTDVISQLGGPNPGFMTLVGAGLELGFRYISKGALIRNDPKFLKQCFEVQEVDIPIEDQLLFLQLGFGNRWINWAIFRSVLSGKENLSVLFNAYRVIKRRKKSVIDIHYQRSFTQCDNSSLSGKVSVLIPTINRYPYLRTLLNQIRNQTISPLEILIMDQTAEGLRDPNLIKDFSDLPLRYWVLNKVGQSSSRNFGLQKSKGDFVLLLDDDVEAPPDLIESHLRNLNLFQSHISSGVVYEKDPDELQKDFRFLRLSNVFPGGNSMIKISVLKNTGLFDLAYDRGQRADHDLGMRLYLSGELMILDPSISILHHHAPVGGLREHKARVSTRAGSRKNMFEFNLPSVSDIYLAKRYFSDVQVEERNWISILGTFSMHGGVFRRLLKIIVSLSWLPYHLYVIHKRKIAADIMLHKYPQIPCFVKE